MKNKKILIISNYNPFFYSGGMEMVIKSITEKMSERFNVFLICKGQVDKSYKYKKINIIQLKEAFIPGLSDVDYALKINKVVEKINPSIIIDNGSISFLVNLNKYKTLSIAHGTNYGYFKTIKINSIKSLFKKIYRFFWAKIQKNHLEKCFKIVSVSNRVKDELIEKFYNIDRKKIEVIDNGTFVKINKKIEQHIKNKQFSNKCLFVSTNHDIKGIDVIEKLAIKLKNITFLICGKPHISNIQNIISLGNLSKAEIFEKSIESDFLIFPSKYEGQSLAVLDSLAAGMPVVLSSMADVGFIDNYINGFIVKDRENVEEYINYINYIYKNFNAVKDIRSNNMNLMKKYSFEKQSNKYLELISKII